MMEYYFHDYFYSVLHNRVVRLDTWSKHDYMVPLEYIGLGYFFARTNRIENYIILNLESCKYKFIFL